MTRASQVRVLVVEDTEEVARAVRRTLEREGMHVAVAGDAETALELAREAAPDVVVMDVSLPGIDGIEACRRLRTFSDAYVVILSGRDTEADRLIGLSSGADDYVTKPYYPAELAARIRAMLRRPRTTSGASRAVSIGALSIDFDAHEVLLDGSPVELSPIEYELLRALATNPRVTISRNQLLERVWGPSWFGDDHVVDVHVSNLRRKLGDDPHNSRFIRTIRGFGYRLGSG
jgi:DNA-binding response OmpR family regulator